ncbi:MAG: GNAT family N-acetyltransferase [Saprospiraceae bacterium]
MKEVARLREISFRDAGGGTGKEIDIDEFDTSNVPFKQLIVWDPDNNEIIGGYRFILGDQTEKDTNGIPLTPTTELFDISTKFINEYWDQTIELGRSFVQPLYQPTINRKGIFSLDNLWDGLGTLIFDNPKMDYFFGKFTMYPSFNETARDLIYNFLNNYFPDQEKLMSPKYPINLVNSLQSLNEDFVWNDFAADYKTLVRKVRNLGINIPPLVNAYMNLSSTMKVFGTSLNSHFGDVYETGILIKISKIFDEKRDRYVLPYRDFKLGLT